MRKILAEYKEFINQGDIVTIAVGLVMALFFKDIIDAIVDNIIMPIISAIVGQPNFGSIGLFIRGDGDVVSDAEGNIQVMNGDGTFLSIGNVFNAVLVFLLVAFVLYLIVKLYNKYIVKPDADIVAETELSVLAEIRDQLRASNSGGPGVPPPPGGPVI